MSKGFLAKDYPISGTGVVFKINDADIQYVYDRCEALSRENIQHFGPRRVLQEGAKYHGVWLETQPMGGEMYATRDMEAALNNHLIFMEHQRRDGRMPGKIGQQTAWGDLVVHQDWMQGDFFSRSALRMYYFIKEDKEYLKRLYTALKDYDEYLWSCRDSDGDGCLETWCMWDTGDDNNTRFMAEGVHARYNGGWNGEEPPTNCGGLPFESAEYMAYNYSQRCVLAQISDILGNGEGDYWRAQAAKVQQKVRDYLWDPEKKAVFDRDRSNKMMYCLTLENLKCMYHHVFTQEMADEFVHAHLLNKEEFNTPLPLPNIAANDPLFYVNEHLNNFTEETRTKIRPFMAKDTLDNSWSGPVEGLSVQRSLDALLNYGYAAEAAVIGRKWISNLARTRRFVQQYDPMDGSAAPGDDGYGPTMLAALEYITYLFGVDFVNGKLIWSAALEGADSEYDQLLFGHHYRLIRHAGIASAYCDDKLLFTVGCGLRITTDLSGHAEQLVCFEPAGAPLHFVQGQTTLDGFCQANEKIELINEPAVSEDAVKDDTCAAVKNRSCAADKDRSGSADKDASLLWSVREERTLMHTPVFDLTARDSLSASGLSGSYYVLHASDWVVTIPVQGDQFLMVRQWRHGLGDLSMEFPGGLADADASPAENAARELTEETGMKAGKLTHLASFNPNPALFTNQLHIFLAEDLTDAGPQRLDADEFLHVYRVPIDEVIDQMGTGPYTHAFLGTAIGLYLRHIQKTGR